MKNMVPTFGKDEPTDTEFVKKVDYDAKVLEIENSIKGKADKNEIPKIPDHSIYALKDEIPKDYLKKEQVDSLLEKKADKSDLPDLKPYIKKENLPDFNTLATKAELELKASIEDMAKKVSIEDMAKYKKAIDESLKSKTNKSETYTKQEIKDRYVKKDAHQKDLEKKMDRINLPDFDSFAKKSDLDGLVAKDCVDLRDYAKKDQIPLVEHSYCLVKLENDFRFYDGLQDAHECYIGTRGSWKTENIINDGLQKPSEWIYWTPFDGIFDIDFSCTVRKYTHLCKPQVIQRIRTSITERTFFEYFDNKSVEIGARDDVTVKTFTKTCKLWLPKGAWIRFSMEFTNRSHNKRKDWIHCVGAQGSYTPTYFCIHGIRMT